MIIRLNSILKSNTKKPRQCKRISEACFLAQKKTIVQEGERNDGPPPATIATSEGVLHALGKYVTLHVLWGVMKSTRNSGYV